MKIGQLRLGAGVRPEQHADLADVGHFVGAREGADFIGRGCAGFAVVDGQLDLDQLMI